MKSKKTDKISIFTIFLLFSLVSTYLYLNYNTNIDFKSSSQESIEAFDNLKHSNQWTLPNIYITNWSIANKTHDWVIYEDGYYIIENVSITGINGIYGIHIENTTESFIIRNCRINEGVQLLRAESGELINNTIYLFYEEFIHKNGISLDFCSNIIIGDNRLDDVYDENYYFIHGFLISRSKNITIKENTLSIIGNSTFPEPKGISVESSSNIEIINNTICGFEIGIDLDRDITECTVIENQIYNSQRNGLFVTGNNHTISKNIVKNSRVGVLFFASNSMLFDNKISEVESGIRTYNAYNNIIDSNSIQHVSEYGIHAEESNLNNITNNIIQNAGEVGIYLDFCHYNLIIGNYIAYNLRCIVEEINCYENIISDNVCIELLDIPGYYPLLILGILIVITFIFINFKIKGEN
ncbi:MAG: right-handed parallel beta-helix repeat-containing protein [Candidatus Hermodarchaeota archaeon]